MKILPVGDENLTKELIVWQRPGRLPGMGNFPAEDHGIFLVREIKRSRTYD